MKAKPQTDARIRESDKTLEYEYQVSTVIATVDRVVWFSLLIPYKGSYFRNVPPSVRTTMQIPIPIRRFGRSINSNSPIILSGLAVAGVVATAVLAVRATPKAIKALEEAEIVKNSWTLAQAAEREESVKVDDYIPLTTVEIVKATWALYLPTAISGVATITCITGSNAIGMRRNIALAGAYTLIDGAFEKYKNEVIEQIGAKKEQTVRDNVLVKEMEQNPPKSSEVIMLGGGDVLCYESLSGRYFRSDAETIRRAANDYNRELLNNRMFCDLNLWFDYLGLEPTIMGGALGWSVERVLDTHFTSHVSPDGQPCLAIGYKQYPFEDFGKL